ncbi:MAG: hypothetical protein QF521_02555, partial [Alphaproteobacteria bacterium]|nr:hypothetical protein [Alphaproteobacteria bacterium]
IDECWEKNINRKTPDLGLSKNFRALRITELIFPMGCSYCLPIKNKFVTVNDFSDGKNKEMRRPIACKWNAEMTNFQALAVGENAFAKIGRCAFVAETKLQCVERPGIVVRCHPVAHRAAALHFFAGKIENIAANQTPEQLPISILQYLNLGKVTT